MEKEAKIKITKILKPLITAIAVALWIDVIITIASSPAPFMEQAPYCMGSTMLIFAILSGIYKGLEFWVEPEKLEALKNEEQ